MKNKLLIVLLFAATVWGFTSVKDQTSSCVNVYVDFGSLNNNIKQISCVDTDHKENALVLLEHAGIKIEGTQKYGLQVVCRVNELPGPDKESCESMPPENAYWAVIVKQNSSPVSVATKWNWAQTGISDVYLEPGDSLGLVFTENEDMRWPD